MIKTECLRFSTDCVNLKNLDCTACSLYTVRTSYQEQIIAQEVKNYFLRHPIEEKIVRQETIKYLKDHVGLRLLRESVALVINERVSKRTIEILSRLDKIDNRLQMLEYRLKEGERDEGRKEEVGSSEKPGIFEGRAENCRPE